MNNLRPTSELKDLRSVQFRKRKKHKIDFCKKKEKYK